MSERKPEPMRDIGAAAWAHNRWPAIGLGAGVGFGAMLGLIFWVGWLLTLLYAAGLGLAGLIIGVALASLIYKGVHRPDEEEGESA